MGLAGMGWECRGDELRECKVNSCEESIGNGTGGAAQVRMHRKEVRKCRGENWSNNIEGGSLRKSKCENTQQRMKLMR